MASGPAETISTAIKAGGSSVDLESVPLTHPRAVAPAYVVVTFTEDGRMHRRQVYLSLHSALKARERAEARGRRFELALFELVPTTYKPVIVVGGGDG